MCTNPAYGEGSYYNDALLFLVIIVLQVYHPSAQRSELKTNINPAYETVVHHNACFHTSIGKARHFPQ